MEVFLPELRKCFLYSFLIYFLIHSLHHVKEKNEDLSHEKKGRQSFWLEFITQFSIFLINWISLWVIKVSFSAYFHNTHLYCVFSPFCLFLLKHKQHNCNVRKFLLSKEFHFLPFVKWEFFNKKKIMKNFCVV